ncbi:MAG: hypothetical protein AAF661_13530 [Pseudomonadota bacterium]
MRLILIICAISLAIALQTPAQAGLLSTLGKIAREAGEAGVKSGDELSGLGAAARGALDDVKTPGAKAMALAPDADGRLHVADEAGVETRLASDSDVDALFRAAEDPDAIEVFADASTVARRDSVTIALAERGALKLKRQGKAYAVELSSEGGLLVRLSDDLAVEAGPLLDEALFALQKPINRANLRPLRFDDQAASSQLSSAPRPKDGVNQIDALSPDDIENGFARLKGQVVIVQGQLRDDVLRVEVGDVSLDRLRKAAHDADVHLVLLDTGVAAQPAGIGLKLSEAMQADTFASFLGALARGNKSFTITAATGAKGRVRLAARPATEIDTSGSAVGDAGLAETGAALDLALQGVELATRDMDDERERELRIHPGVHSDISTFVIMNVVLGLAAARTGWRGFRWIWPSPTRLKWLVHPIRFTVFALVFLPLTGAVCFIASILIGVWRALAWFFGLFGFGRAA